MHVSVLVDQEGRLGPDSWQTLKSIGIIIRSVITMSRLTDNSPVLPVFTMFRRFLLCSACLAGFTAQLEVSSKGCFMSAYV